MNVGILQRRIIFENKEANLKALENYLELNRDRSLDLVLLPEMSFTGFSMNTELTGELNAETEENIRQLCLKYKTAIGFGWVKNKKKSENHYTVIDSSGRIISDYIKIHPFSYARENEHYISGNSLDFFELNGIVFSSFICYDLRFPELFRVASIKASVIIVAANWPQKRNEHWETLLKARAIENQVYIIGINCVGNIGEIDYCGSSCVVRPDGEMETLAYGTETNIIYDLKNDVSLFRNEFPTYKDRKDSLYVELQKGALEWK